MTDRADNGIDGVKFAASAAAPNILPFFHAELGNTRDEIRSWEFCAVLIHCHQYGSIICRNQ